MSFPLEIDLEDGAATHALPNAQLALLRSRVETELGKPAVVLVTSALLGDGKSLTAHSLASCLLKSGHRAALVSPTAGTREPNELPILDLPPEQGNAVHRARLAAFVEGVRSNYDFTIVDAGAFLSSNTAMALAPMVDGILLAVRLGRASSDEDELLVKTIEHSGGRIVGVVAISEDVIAEFERKQVGGGPTAPERLRRDTEAPPARLHAPARSLAKLEI